MGPAAPTRADFDRLYDAEFDYVWSTLRRLGVPDAHVEDVAHEVFITAWKRLADYDRSRPIRPWLFGIAYRTASDFRDKAWQRREVADAEPDGLDERPTADAQLETKQAKALVLKALESIPLDRRAVFIMHELEGEPIPAVATALDVPLNTAYSRLRLARRDFQDAVNRLKEAP